MYSVHSDLESNYRTISRERTSNNSINNSINNLQSNKANSNQVVLKNKIYLTNIFIIDWDDTLFPTTWIHSNGINLNDENSVSNYKLYFLELDKTLSKFLDSFNKIGDIYVVTNANIKWIKSCLGILNITRNTIIKNNIRIVSARDSYSQVNNSPTEWKILTFQDILEDIVKKITRNLKPNTCLNILSIGDANYEYIALVNLDAYFKQNLPKTTSNINYLLKSIKFVEKPEFNYIIDQLNVVYKNQNSIINKLGYIDLKFK
jgi:hypothetical protein